MRKYSYDMILDSVEHLVMRSEQLYALSLVSENVISSPCGDVHSVEMVQSLNSELVFELHQELTRLQSSIMELRSTETR